MTAVRIPSAKWGPNQTDGYLERGADLLLGPLQKDGTCRIGLTIPRYMALVANPAVLDRAGRDALRAALAAMDQEEQG